MEFSGFSHIFRKCRRNIQRKMNILNSKRRKKSVEYCELHRIFFFSKCSPTVRLQLRTPIDCYLLLFSIFERFNLRKEKKNRATNKTVDSIYILYAGWFCLTDFHHSVFSSSLVFFLCFLFVNFMLNKITEL